MRGYVGGRWVGRQLEAWAPASTRTPVDEPARFRDSPAPVVAAELIAEIARAREHARVRVEEAALAAVQLAEVDLERLAATDQIVRARLSNELRHRLRVLADAEHRAVMAAERD